MKKVLLPLLLLFAISFLIAVESAPSAVVGYVKYPCLTGSNLIALPMDAGTVTSATIGAANVSLTSIAAWDAVNQFWTSSDAYDDGEGGVIWDPEYTYTPGTGLMVYSTTDFNFFSLGGLPSVAVTFPMEIGTNIISVPLDRSDLSDTALLGAAIPQLTSIALWDNVNQFWSSSDAYDDGEGGFIWDPVQNTPIGTPVMVYSTEQFTWPSAKGLYGTASSSRTTK